MKKSQFKRIMALFLAVSMLVAGETGALAGTVDTKAEYLLSAESGAGVDNWEQQPIGTPFTDVTEDEALAFERGLKTQLSSVVGTDTLLSQNAKKKATALVSLYGETSVQYAVMQNGELVLSDAYGTDDASKKTTVTTDSLYGVASISKIFTTAAVMKLVEAGKINLDQPVVKYIPEFQMKDARCKDITVRMLLNHSSGL